ncbi:MAG: hypothetical protein HC912_09395, partial [Saprospiraceae bacterium]|nr:hypothetical protein [Saprospiraceae bacterium]
MNRVITEKNVAIEEFDTHIKSLTSKVLEQERTYGETLQAQMAIVEEKQQMLDTATAQLNAQYADLAQIKMTLQLLEQQFQASHQHIDQLEGLQQQIQQEKTNLVATYEGLVQQFQASQQHIDELEEKLTHLKEQEANWQETKMQLEQKWSNQYEATIIQYHDAIDQINTLKQRQ